MQLRAPVMMMRGRRLVTAAAALGGRVRHLHL